MSFTSLHLSAPHPLSLLQPPHDRGDIAHHHRDIPGTEAFVTGSHAKQVLKERRSRTGTYAYKKRLLHGLIDIRSFTSLSFDPHSTPHAHFIAITTAA